MITEHVPNMTTCRNNFLFFSCYIFFVHFFNTGCAAAPWIQEFYERLKERKDKSFYKNRLRKVITGSLALAHDTTHSERNSTRISKETRQSKIRYSWRNKIELFAHTHPFVCWFAFDVPNADVCVCVLHLLLTFEFANLFEWQKPGACLMWISFTAGTHLITNASNIQARRTQFKSKNNLICRTISFETKINIEFKNKKTNRSKWIQNYHQHDCLRYFDTQSFLKGTPFLFWFSFIVNSSNILMHRYINSQHFQMPIFKCIFIVERIAGEHETFSNWT